MLRSVLHPSRYATHTNDSASALQIIKKILEKLKKEGLNANINNLVKELLQKIALGNIATLLDQATLLNMVEKVVKTLVNSLILQEREQALQHQNDANKRQQMEEGSIKHLKEEDRRLHALLENLTATLTSALTSIKDQIAQWNQTMQKAFDSFCGAYQNLIKISTNAGLLPAKPTESDIISIPTAVATINNKSDTSTATTIAPVTAMTASTVTPALQPEPTTSSRPGITAPAPTSSQQQHMPFKNQALASLERMRRLAIGVTQEEQDKAAKNFSAASKVVNYAEAREKIFVRFCMRLVHDQVPAGYMLTSRYERQLEAEYSAKFRSMHPELIQEVHTAIKECAEAAAKYYEAENMIKILSTNSMESFLNHNLQPPVEERTWNPPKPAMMPTTPFGY